MSTMHFGAFLALCVSAPLWGETLPGPTYNGRSTYVPQSRGDDSGATRRMSGDSQNYAPGGTEPWERHVTDRHQSFDHQKQCNEEGCLYTDRHLHRYEKLDQYYVPHGRTRVVPQVVVPQGTVPAHDFYFLNRSGQQCRFTVTYYDSFNQIVTQTFDISPGESLFVGRIASGSGYSVTGKLADEGTYRFQQRAHTSARTTQTLDGYRR